MKKSLFIFGFLICCFIFPFSAQAAGTYFNFGFTVFKQNLNCQTTVYPTVANNTLTILTDNNVQTRQGVGIGECLYGSLNGKKNIDGVNIQLYSSTEMTGSINLFDSNQNYIKSIPVNLRYGAINGPKINEFSPEIAYFWSLTNVTAGGVYQIGEIRLYAQPDNTAPSIPTLSGSTSSKNVTLNWTKPNDVDLAGYKIFRNGIEIANITNKNTLSYTDSNLNFNETYNYSIKSYDDTNIESNFSNLIYLTPIDNTGPSAITNLEGNGLDNEVYLSWSPSIDNDNVSGYRVFKNGVLEKTVTTTNTTISGLFNGTTYNFSVIAFDPSGNVSTSVNVNVIPIDIFPPYQAAPTIGSITETSLEILWSFSTSADIDYYEVQRTGQTTWSTVDHSGNITYSYNFTGLNSGATYNLRVRAVDDDNNKSAIQSIQGTTSAYPPGTPAGLQITAGDNQNNLNWSNNTESDLSGYKVYLTSSNTSISTVNTSSYIHSGLSNGVQKCYQISAFDIHGNESAKSTPICSTPIDIYPPFDISNLTTISMNEYDYTFQWTGSTSQDISKYKIYKNDLITETKNHVNGQTIYQYTATGLTPGVTYNFQVNPVDDDENELLTGTNGSISFATIGTPPAIPLGFTATPGTDKITFNWTENTESDFSHYKIFLKNGSTYSEIVTTTGDFYEYNSTNYTSQQFVIQAFDNGGTASDYSSVVTTAALPVTPVPPTPPAPLFGGVTSPIAASDIVESGLSLMGMLKWIILIGLAIWLASKLILRKQNIVKTISDPNKTETKQDQPEKIEKKKRRRRSKGLFGFIKDYYRDKKEKQKEEKKREKIRKERQRVTTLKKDLREKLSKSLVYKVYKK